MYLRFIGPWKSRLRNIDYGIFQTAFIARDDQLMPSYLIDALMKEVDWFKTNLPSPDERHFDYAGHNVGICWFRDDAKTMIRRTRRMVDIFRAGDIWITEARTENPGWILYRDDFQIIAKPRKSTPTKWGQTHKALRR